MNSVKLSENMLSTCSVWYKLECKGQPVGKLAAMIALRLMGKTKPIYHKSTDMGDHVVAVNSRLVKFTGNKWSDKMYYSHNMYPGLKSISAQHLHEKDPTAVLRKAVFGMLPRNRLRKKFMSRLHIFPGNENDVFGGGLQKPLPKEKNIAGPHYSKTILASYLDNCSSVLRPPQVVDEEFGKFKILPGETYRAEFLEEHGVEVWNLLEMTKEEWVKHKIEKSVALKGKAKK
eukprot:Nk52_evm109s914 gene=Nk52_evmTU109s914